MIINIQIHPFSVALTTGAPVLCSGRSPIFARMITVAAFVVLVVAGGVASGQGQSGRSITVSELNQEIDLSGDVHHVTFDASEPGVIFRFTGATPGQVVSFLFRSGNITLDEAAFSVTASPFAQVASPGIRDLFDSMIQGLGYLGDQASQWKGVPTRPFITLCAQDRHFRSRKCHLDAGRVSPGRLLQHSRHTDRTAE